MSRKKRGPVQLQVVPEADAPVDAEVLQRPQRRTFTAEYKRRVLEEADGCKEPGEVGALLRREGLYSSHLTAWRQARERGELHGLTPRKRGPKGQRRQARKLAHLERENARLRRELETARTIIDVQKKLSEMLGIELPTTGSDE